VIVFAEILLLYFDHLLSFSNCSLVCQPVKHLPEQTLVRFLLHVLNANRAECFSWSIQTGSLADRKAAYFGLQGQKFEHLPNLLISDNSFWNLTFFTQIQFKCQFVLSKYLTVKAQQYSVENPRY